jgi:hypothetical protein
LNKAVYPSRENWRKSQAAQGCPEFGAASVLERPMDYDREPEFSVRPGLVEPERGSHQVVWWDPAKLRLGEDAGHGLRQKQILQEDGGASLGAYRQWREQRASVLHAAALPRFEVFLASQATEAPPGDPVDVGFASTVEPRSVGGRRFGTLVHAVLRDTALDATGTPIRRLAELNARILGASAEESSAAREAVERALAHPLIERARAAKRCHREYPVMLKLDGNRLLEGVIDLAFLENDSWIVVDFKTDTDLADQRTQYERQVQWYAYALRNLLRTPARAYLFAI